MTSILVSIKKLLGLTDTYTPFDADIIMHINTVFMTLHQLGVGPSVGFKIEDDIAVWTDYLSDSILLEAAKSYVYMKVKLMFDPPSSSFVIESYKTLCSELEWRLTEQVMLTAPPAIGGNINE